MVTKQAEAEPDIIEVLADDAAPPDYPDGAPLLKSWLQIRPRSRRAEFKRRFADFQGMQRTIQAANKSAAMSEDADEGNVEVAAERLRLWADADDMYQAMDDLMRLAAVNEDHYTEWSDEVEDADLVRTFNVFVKRSQPGEVSRSAS